MIAFLIGIGIWLVIRVLSGLFVVQQNERAVKTVLGKAIRKGALTTADDPVLAESLRPEERERYIYPQLEVIGPGGPYFKWPWETVHKVNVSTQLVNIAFDPDNSQVNQNNTILEAVTNDQLNIAIKGELRLTVSERNIYAYLFGIHRPISHLMGYIVSILRERIANFRAQNSKSEDSKGLLDDFNVSINDLRKNLGDLNTHMMQECASSAARYGVDLDAVLVTTIDPPDEVESALAAINTTQNQVSSSISLAQASADQKIVQSRRALEIATLNAQAEVQILNDLATQLVSTKAQGVGVLAAYVRNAKLSLLSKAKKFFFHSSI
jgi:regulator of protease activity HflC (stomatin/prohibitin superfamily)